MGWGYACGVATLFDQPEDWQPPARESVPVLAWVDAGQVGLLGVLAKMAGLRVVGVGGPWQGRGSGQESPELGELGWEACGDFRRAIVEREAKLVLVMSGGSLESERGGVADDEGVRERATEAGAVVLSLPAVMRAMAPERPMRSPGSVYQVPLFVRSPMMGDLREVLGALGRVRSLVAHFRCGAAHGVVGGRFFDAMTLAHVLLGEPEQVDAAVVGPGGGVAGVKVSAAGFDELRGDVLCTLRYIGGHAASIAASDCGGRWSRGFTIVADGGVVRATDRGFEVLDHEGKTIDAGGRQANTVGTGGGSDGAAVIAASIIRMTDPRTPDGEVFDAEAVLASCHAAALSARTGQGESPATMRHVRGAVRGR